jgi:hypothetical protein
MSVWSQLFVTCVAQLMLWQTFAQQAGQAQASKTFEDVEVEGTDV